MNTNLSLHILPRPLLGNLLRNALLVHPPVHLCPSNLPGVLALQEEGLVLRAEESEGLTAISAPARPGDRAQRTLESPRT